MERICAWCNTDLGTLDLGPGSKHLITHGICEKCKTMLLGPQRVPLLKFLDGLHAPVVVVNSSGKVETANVYARSIVKKELLEIEGFDGGNVFDCAYSALPEGCGKTIHCDGCTIRNTVMNTFQTGESQLEVKATLIHGTPENNQEINLLISTEKFADVVLLRIDKMGMDE